MKPRKGFDKRTGKSVVVVGEIAPGVKLFSGVKNKQLSPKSLDKLASHLVALCEQHGIKPQGLGLALVRLGWKIQVVDKKRRVKHGS